MNEGLGVQHRLKVAGFRKGEKDGHRERVVGGVVGLELGDQIFRGLDTAFVEGWTVPTPGDRPKGVEGTVFGLACSLDGKRRGQPDQGLASRSDQ